MTVKQDPNDSRVGSVAPGSTLIRVGAGACPEDPSGHEWGWYVEGTEEARRADLYCMACGLEAVVAAAPGIPVEDPNGGWLTGTRGWWKVESFVRAEHPEEEDQWMHEDFVHECEQRGRRLKGLLETTQEFPDRFRMFPLGGTDGVRENVPGGLDRVHALAERIVEALGGRVTENTSPEAIEAIDRRADRYRELRSSMAFDEARRQADVEEVARLISAWESLG